MSATPTRLGPYEIVTRIGAGGMGEVYRATDTRLGRMVAIKVLPAHVAADPALRACLEREAKAISSLNHPHICTLCDIGHQGGTDRMPSQIKPSNASELLSEFSPDGRWIAMQERRPALRVSRCTCGPGGTPYDVARDGRFLVDEYVAAEPAPGSASDTSSFTVVLNWASGL
jgi:serine/threonine protein kinase